MTKVTMRVMMVWYYFWGIRTPMLRFAILLAAFLAATPALAARCGGDFQTFVRNISAEAAAAGISQEVIASALGGVTQDAGVLAFDRRQRGTFRKTFEEYVATRVGAGRISGARADRKSVV